MPRYAQSKHEFFHTGVDNQKRPDVIIDMRRPDKKKMMDWTDEQKKELKEWLRACEKSIQAFKEEILSI